MIVPKEMPFCPALLGKERGTHSLLPAQSVQLILPHILRFIPQELEGEEWIIRPCYVFETQGTGEKASGFPPLPEISLTRSRLA